MGSLSGILQRPVVAVSAVAVASVYSDIHDILWPSKSSDAFCALDRPSFTFSDSLQGSVSSWMSLISVSKLADISFLTKIRVPFPNINFPASNGGNIFVPNLLQTSISSSPALLNLYKSADLAKLPKPTGVLGTVPNATPAPELLYRWHSPDLNAIDVSGKSDFSSAKSRTLVILLGWLGAKQKHLKRYAEWYTSRGFHVITFTFPMAEILRYQVGGKAEQHVELLVNHLADWLDEEDGKNLVFHTFSNTGWLTYGAILEKFQKQDHSLIGRIKGCIVDSAPVAAPDPQVWASGFSAAFLKKHSIATKGYLSLNKPGVAVSVGTPPLWEAKPAITEAALLLVLEKFFEVVLNLPKVNRRLSDVLVLLRSGQPNCPQLYIYSSADRVIPAATVKSFIEEQRKSGREVRACDFISTPHVDHFRNDPALYTSQLTQFMEDCVLVCCKSSS